ncbi:hypothetical protein PV325_011459 [Microctonus aethiopoides]|nr:hypothetical protein PV325_011459 [Microctonus aethiopoides]
MMKNNSCKIIPVHERPDLLIDCCKLINSEWPSSDTRRLRTLSMSCDSFPTCLVLLNNDNVIGHCKISLVPNLNDSCFIESVVIDFGCRSQGFGSILMKGTEDYVRHKGIKNVYLSTKGQEKFYEKNGYSICEPINMWDNRTEIISTNPVLTNKQTQIFSGPPPPPMPKFSSTYSPIITSKTYMIKQL